MRLIDNLVAYFNKPETETKEETPEGLCPVCWGHQQYDQQIRDLYKDKQVDVNNQQARYTLIRDFVVNKLDGIRLKKEGAHVHECPECGTQAAGKRP